MTAIDERKFLFGAYLLLTALKVDFVIVPIVTVGVCVKNDSLTIHEAIESIINQDFPHELMEIIFIDDGSEDNTLSIIQKNISNIDMAIKVFHTDWQGLGSARNMVFNSARGRYVLWVDSDMIVPKHYGRKLVEFMEQNNEVGIAKGKYELKPGSIACCIKMVDFNYGKKSYSKSLGTGGSIYRLEAIKQIGGFDEKIKGYGEDWDAEYRIKARGWLLSIVDVPFRDYERHGMSWKNLWYRYLKRGHGMQGFLTKNKGMIDVYKMLPPIAFIGGFLDSLKIYRLTRQKIGFLLPFQYVFKMTAWCIGFFKAFFVSSH